MAPLHARTTRLLRSLVPAAAALVALAASAQLVEPRTAAEKALVESVKRRLSRCFTTLGVDASIPLATAPPADREMLASVLMTAAGAPVNDGFNYVLKIHGPSNAAFVVRMGGFASVPAVYGPVPLARQCD